MNRIIVALGFAAAVMAAAPAIACENAPLRAGWNGTGDLYSGLLLAAETGYAGADDVVAVPARAEVRPAAPASWKLATIDRRSTARAAAESAWGAAWHGATRTPVTAAPTAWHGHYETPDPARAQANGTPPGALYQPAPRLGGSATYALRRWADGDLEARIEAEAIALLLDRAARLYAGSDAGSRTARAEGERAFRVATRRMLAADDAIAAADPAAHRALEAAYDALAPAYVGGVSAAARPDIAMLVAVTARTRATLGAD